MSSESGNGPQNQPGESPLDEENGAIFREFETLVSSLADPTYLFRLFVSGTSPRSALAITNVRRICDEYLPGHYELEVIDVYQQQGLTKDAQVVAVPTLIKELPLPQRRFVGDMSDAQKIVIGLKLKH